MEPRTQRQIVAFGGGGVSDLRSHLLAQDLIYVGGGSVISLLGVWRAHGIDSILREAWEAGVVLCGLSAGSLSSRAGARAYKLERRGPLVVETKLATRFLGSDQPVTPAVGPSPVAA